MSCSYFSVNCIAKYILKKKTRMILCNVFSGEKEQVSKPERISEELFLISNYSFK